MCSWPTGGTGPCGPPAADVACQPSQDLGSIAVVSFFFLCCFDGIRYDYCQQLQKKNPYFLMFWAVLWPRSAPGPR